MPNWKESNYMLWPANSIPTINLLQKYGEITSNPTSVAILHNFYFFFANLPFVTGFTN